MELDDTERVVLEELHDAIGEETSITYRLPGVAGIESALLSLREKGLADYIGTARMRIWHLTEEGKKLFQQT